MLGRSTFTFYPNYVATLKKCNTTFKNLHLNYLINYYWLSTLFPKLKLFNKLLLAKHTVSKIKII